MTSTAALSFSLTACSFICIYLKSLLQSSPYARQCSQPFRNMKSFSSHHNSRGRYSYFTHSSDEGAKVLTQTGFPNVCGLKHYPLLSHQHLQISLFVYPQPKFRERAILGRKQIETDLVYSPGLSLTSCESYGWAE